MKQTRKKKSIVITNKDLLGSAIEELTFANTCISNLLDNLEEVKTSTKDPLIGSLISNMKDRHHLSKMIHAKNLFIKK